MTKYQLLIFMAIILALAACSNISDQRVTNETRSAVASKVAASSMSDQDKTLYAAVNSRAKNGDYDVTDKTVRQMVDDERAYEVEQKAEADRQQQLADEARAKRDARMHALSSALTVALVSKGFQDADYENMEYQSYITVQLALKDRSPKTIRSLKGIVHFQNTLGDDLKTVPLSYEQLLTPNATTIYDGLLKFNQFDDSDVALRNADMRNLRLRWEPRIILFDDGSRLNAESNTND